MSDLPCPFCGGDMMLVHVPPERIHQRALIRPQCMKCGCDLGGFDTRAKAIAAWNTRIPKIPAPAGDAARSRTVLSAAEAITDRAADVRVSSHNLAAGPSGSAALLGGEG